MTTNDERDQRELRDLLAKRAEVREGEIQALRGFVAQLPARRRRLPGRGLLAAAASVTVLLGVGLVLLNFPWGSSGAAPAPPNPAYFATDPRLAVCNAKATDAEAIFELHHLSDYAAQLPNAYPLVGLQADPTAPALVIVFKGPGSVDREGATPPPNSHDICLVVGTDAASWQHIGVVAVDTTGLLAVRPEPTGTPIATEELPWVERCGGVEAGINRILHLPHGTDAMTLNSVAVPQSAMSADPMTIIVYDGAHPFPPQGTQPPAGVTFEPRNAPKPGENDLCILSGADPTTAKRTIVEYGTQFEAGPPPSVAPIATEQPTGAPTEDACSVITAADMFYYLGSHFTATPSADGTTCDYRSADASQHAILTIFGEFGSADAASARLAAIGAVAPDLAGPGIDEAVCSADGRSVGARTGNLVVSVWYGNTVGAPSQCALRAVSWSLDRAAFSVLTGNPHPSPFPTNS